MITNNLNVLLAERNITVSDLSKIIPDLSRNTLTSIKNGNSKMYQLDTINKLCEYLKITPNDLFTYVPFDLKPEVKVDKINLRGVENMILEFNLILQIKKLNQDHLMKVYRYNGNYIDSSLAEDFTNILRLHPEKKNDGFIELWKNELPIIFHKTVILQIQNIINQSLIDKIKTEFVEDHQQLIIDQIKKLHIELDFMNLP